MKNTVVARFVVSLAVLALVGVGLPMDASARGGRSTKEKVKVEFYVMSKCPFGVKVLDAFLPVFKEMRGYIDFHLDFIADDLGNGSFKALHGEPEVEGNILMLCAMEHAGEKAWPFIGCMNGAMREIPDNWEACARSSGLDLKRMRWCADGKEGERLLRTSLERAKKKGARGSPTMFVNGTKYAGGRERGSFKRAVCRAFSGRTPAACADLPAPVPVDVIVLTDSRCKECQTGAMTGRLRSMFEGLKVTEYDYSTPEGKRLYQRLGVTLLPVYLFDKAAERAEGYTQLKRYMKPLGEYLSLSVGAKFDPTAEICDNGIDDTGNGQVDCADETCADNLLCRQEQKQRLDLFVMSQCPYGVKALDAMGEILGVFRAEIDFRVHYIATVQDDGSFKSLHGQPEVDEDIRELCAMEHYPADYKFMDYISCRNKDIRSSDWQLCAGAGTGIDPGVIRRCSEGEEGRRLLIASIKQSTDAGFTASPSWLANNVHQFSGITAEQIRENFCKHNPQVEACQ